MSEECNEALEAMLAAHAEIVRVAAASYGKMRDAQSAHSADRAREHQSYEAIYLLISKAVTDHLTEIDDRYEPVGQES